MDKPPILFSVLSSVACKIFGHWVPLKTCNFCFLLQFPVRSLVTSQVTPPGRSVEAELRHLSFRRRSCGGTHRCPVVDREAAPSIGRHGRLAAAGAAHHADVVTGQGNLSVVEIVGQYPLSISRSTMMNCY